MRTRDLIGTLETVAPLHYAEEWDNVGLLVGDTDAELSGPPLLAIDLTSEVLAEAREIGAGALVVYHPPIFHALTRLTAQTRRGATLLGAVRSELCVYSPHTALDAAPGGVTDWLCDMLGEEGERSGSIGDRRALVAHARGGGEAQQKIVVFTPASHAARLREALASIGAGRIGEYEMCSFNTEGKGTFLGGDSTAPAVGRAGHLETVEEVRLEMVCPARAAPLAIEVIHQFHPYEEPAVDIYDLAAKPLRGVGSGRRVTLDQPVSAAELAERLKRNLGVDAVKLAQADGEPVERIGVCPGAGASLLDAAIEEGCRAFVTGEMRHHEALAAVERGCSVLLAGHTNTERGYLPRYAARIEERSPGTGAVVSRVDGPLFRTI